MRPCIFRDTNPRCSILEIYHSESAYHAGDEVPVQWFYNGTGEKFQIELLKEGDVVADLCAAEEDGLCFDLTQEQTITLPTTR